MVPPHHTVPGLYMGHSTIGTGLPSTMIAPRTNEEERWLARQRKLRQEKEDRQYQVSEFRQQVLEQHLDLSRTADPEHRSESQRYGSTHYPHSTQHGQHHYKLWQLLFSHDLLSYISHFKDCFGQSLLPDRDNNMSFFVVGAYVCVV